ncbi:aldo/keto reductase [Corticicoccus populi]|uniref:Aldo/keto reductase n=1 Tax=Corticicoccus populi TaxID=1812821 RepID=A0ABW5WUV1_9STAP
MALPYVELNDGNELPVIGFGTVSLKGNSGALKISEAVRNGYRFIDTAYNYENEGTVGRAIKQSGLKRSEFFVQSKLPGRYHGYEDAMEAIQESLYRADLEYFDLYIIHWPNPKEDQYVEAWRALIDAQKNGWIKSIGVSNFMPEHIDRLISETGVKPVLNQIELHPKFNQREMRKYHDENNIVTMAWSPLGRLRYLKDSKVIDELAEKYSVNIGQLVLRWHYQHGVVTIPRSSNGSRQRGNLDIFNFEISGDDMKKIDAETVEDGRIDDQDPREYQEF